MFKHYLLAIIATASTAAQANTPEPDYWVSLKNNAVPQSMRSQITPLINGLQTLNPKISVLHVNKSQLEQIQQSLHQRGEHGGYMLHASMQDALATANMAESSNSFDAPTLNQKAQIESLLPQLDATKIIDMIKKQSQQRNRIYSLSTGRQASDALSQNWEDLVKDIPYAAVSQIQHKKFPQRSVQVKFTGSKYPDDIIVLGGHLDSTAGIFHTKRTKAPGADDNASGIASLTDIIRVFAENNIQPERTIVFFGYAAEEGGLLGSRDVAQNYKSKHVLSALQMDMTNYRGSDKDYVFMTDYTDTGMTQFLEKLSDTYLSDLTYGEDKCGYGCSDHASWYKTGVPSAMPAESKMSDMNHHIHSSSDTLDHSDITGTHALNISKLGLTYAIEMGFID
ncbi:MAG: M20/M25/M40 family metallo-hydrolase [Shewanella sp.]|nr:M20/M25/M40 family metallo-hydrolase [Shewanella sp.]